MQVFMARLYRTLDDLLARIPLFQRNLLVAFAWFDSMVVINSAIVSELVSIYTW